MINQSYEQKLARANNRLIAVRNDSSLSAARFDEIIKLRMLLMELRQYLVKEIPTNSVPQVQKIDDTAKGWGLKGDCV